MPQLKLINVIRQLTAERGYLSIGEYMALCLGHPEFGYYMTREPFGVEGDFTTAPEVSQLFGEMIAVWIMATWQKIGKNDPLQLIELGPGRGTLMKDIWRGLSALRELQSKTTIHLVEFSDRLRGIQRETLAGLPVTWHDDIKTLPRRKSLIISNEFFDALPIQQAIYHNGHWHQRVIISDEEDFLFSIGAPLQGIYVPEPQDGDIFEYAPMAADIMDKLCDYIKQNGGAILAIDYGDVTPVDERIGETLQALYQKKPDPVLDHPGEADITAHVAFDALNIVAIEHNLLGTVQTQREFLTEHGIRLRAEKLLAKADDEQTRTINAEWDRLINPDQMGDLFKVFQVINS